ADARAADYNPAGEDFLYMHHGMIEGLRAELIHSNGGALKCIEGWKEVPDLADWKLPDNDRAGPKSPEALRQLKTWDLYFHNRAWLSSHSLSQIGFALEFTIHNN